MMFKYNIVANRLRLSFLCVYQLFDIREHADISNVSTLYTHILVKNNIP